MEFVMNINKRIAPLAIAMAAVFPAVSHADVPLVDGTGRPARVVCKILPGGSQIVATHMDKIIFKIVGPLTALNAADQMALNAVPHQTTLDIKVLDDSRTVADVKGKVLTFLGAADTAFNRGSLEIDDVDYAVVCPNPDPAGGG
jgi:hypothetical protein